MGSQASQAEDTQRVLDGIRRIVQGLRESSRRAETRYGVSGAQLFVLEKLRQHGSATMTELARLTLTHPSSVSVVVGRLVEAGLVRRDPSPSDARSVVVSLTSRGRMLASRAPDAAQARLFQAVGSLPPATRRQLGRALDELVTLISGTQPGPAPMFFEERSK